MNMRPCLKSSWIVMLGALMLLNSLMLVVNAMGSVSVTIWDIAQEPENTYMKTKIIPTFEKANPGIKVKLEIIPIAEYRSKLIAALTAGMGPDLAWANIPYLMELGFTQPIPETLIDDTYMAQNYLAGHDFKYKGKRHFVPTGTMAQILYYNVDLLKAAGMENKDIGRTYDSLIAAAQKLTKWSDNRLIQAGFAFNGYLETFFNNAIRQEGKPVWSKISEGKFKLHFNTPEAKRAAQLCLDLYDKYRVNTREFLNWNEALGTGKGAIVPWWTWGGPYMNANYPDIKWGAWYCPTYTGHGPYGYCNEMDNVYFVTTSAKGDRTAPAWKLWEFISINDENARLICQAKGIIPLKKSLIQDAWIAQQPDLQILREQMLDPKGGQIFFGSAVESWGVNTGKAIEAIAIHGKKMEETFQAYENIINEDMAKIDAWIVDYRK